MRSYTTVLTALLASFICVSHNAPVDEVLVGKVIKVSDGDTITVLLASDRKTQVKVRLEGIDAPEAKQAFGSRAKSSLSSLVADKTVEVHKTGTDKYDRTLGIVYVDDLNVNAKQVELGFAWHYKEYNDDPELAKLEEQARETRVGLWRDERPLPPWEFRKRQRGESSEPSAPPVNRFGSGDSDTRPSSPPPAAEAKYWLNTSSNVRHNSSCQHFSNTKRGRYCGPNEGKACGQCGG